MSFSALAAASFGLLEKIISGAAISSRVWIAFLAVLILFHGASFLIHYNLETLQRTISKELSTLIYCIKPTTESDRIKRKLLRNLDTISKWTVSPFPNSERQVMAWNMTWLIREILPEKKSQLFLPFFTAPERKMRVVMKLVNTMGFVNIVLAAHIWAFL